MRKGGKFMSSSTNDILEERMRVSIPVPTPAVGLCLAPRIGAKFVYSRPRYSGDAAMNYCAVLAAPFWVDNRGVEHPSSDNDAIAQMESPFNKNDLYQVLDGDYDHEWAFYAFEVEEHYLRLYYYNLESPMRRGKIVLGKNFSSFQLNFLIETPYFVDFGQKPDIVRETYSELSHQHYGSYKVEYAVFMQRYFVSYQGLLKCIRKPYMDCVTQICKREICEDEAAMGHMRIYHMRLEAKDYENLDGNRR